MAKVAFSKLKCKLNETEVPVIFGEETIMVKQYLPIQEKLDLMTKTLIEARWEDINYFNPVKANVLIELEMFFAYTNCTFTEKQKSDVPKLYDVLKSSGLLDMVLNAIPEEERVFVKKGMFDSLQAVYTYDTSILGVLENIKENYQETDLDLKAMLEQLEGSDFSSLQEIVSKMS